MEHQGAELQEQHAAIVAAAGREMRDKVAVRSQFQGLMAATNSTNQNIRKFVFDRRTRSIVAPVRPSHLFDSGGLEKKIAGLRPAIFFLAKFLGLHLCRRVLAEICAAVCWPKSAPPCAGRKFGENLRRRVAMSFLMH